MANKSGTDGWRICKGHRKNGDPCGNAALKGEVFCRIHVGQNKTQIELRRVTAIANRYMPPNILADFERALHDPGLLDLNTEIALIEARMSEVKRAMAEHHGASEAWEVAKKLWDDAANPNSKTCGDSMSKLGTLVQEGVADHYAWKELRELMDLRGRMLNIQVNKHAKLDQFVTKQEMAAFGAELLAEIRLRIPDPIMREQILAAVAAKFQRRPSPARK